MKYTHLLCLCLGIILSGCTSQNPIADQSVKDPTPKSSTATNKADRSQKVTPEKKTTSEKAKQATPSPNARPKTPSTKQPDPPPVASSFEAKMARKALKFLETQWKVAREKGDAVAYGKLLTEDFKGSAK